MKFLAPIDRTIHSIQIGKELPCSFKKAVRVEDSSPKDKHMFGIIDNMSRQDNGVILHKLITGLSMAYRVPKRSMQTYADASSPLGNSINNPHSAAYKAKKFRGLQIFKALHVLHRVLEEYPEMVMDHSRAYLDWMESVVMQEGPSKGNFVGLAQKYSIYLSTRIQLESKSTTAKEKMASKALLELKDSVQEELAEPYPQKVAKLVIKTLIADQDHFYALE